MSTVTAAMALYAYSPLTQHLPWKDRDALAHAVEAANEDLYDDKVGIQVRKADLQRWMDKIQRRAIKNGDPEEGVEAWKTRIREMFRLAGETEFAHEHLAMYLETVYNRVRRGKRMIKSQQALLKRAFVPIVTISGIPCLTGIDIRREQLRDLANKLHKRIQAGYDNQNLSRPLVEHFRLSLKAYFHHLGVLLSRDSYEPTESRVLDHWEKAYRTISTLGHLVDQNVPFFHAYTPAPLFAQMNLVARCTVWIPAPPHFGTEHLTNQRVIKSKLAANDTFGSISLWKYGQIDEQIDDLLDVFSKVAKQAQEAKTWAKSLKVALKDHVADGSDSAWFQVECELERLELLNEIPFQVRDGRRQYTSPCFNVDHVVARLQEFKLPSSVVLRRSRFSAEQRPIDALAIPDTIFEDPDIETATSQPEPATKPSKQLASPPYSRADEHRLSQGRDPTQQKFDLERERVPNRKTELKDVLHKITEKAVANGDKVDALLRWEADYLKVFASSTKTHFALALIESLLEPAKVALMNSHKLTQREMVKWYASESRVKPEFRAHHPCESIHEWRCAQIEGAIGVLAKGYAEPLGDTREPRTPVWKWEKSLSEALKGHLARSRDTTIAWRQIQYELARLELLKERPLIVNGMVSALFNVENVVNRVQEWTVKSAHKVLIHQLSSLGKDGRMGRRAAIMYGLHD
ncbi:hypothetical protein JCM3766R1_000730 [Sporobolomyces carnicolor]